MIGAALEVDLGGVLLADRKAFMGWVGRGVAGAFGTDEVAKSSSSEINWSIVEVKSFFLKFRFPHVIAFDFVEAQFDVESFKERILDLISRIWAS